MRTEAEYPPLTSKQKVVVGIFFGCCTALLTGGTYLFASLATGMVDWPVRGDVAFLVENVAESRLGLDPAVEVRWFQLPDCSSEDPVTTDGVLQCAPFQVSAPQCHGATLRHCMTIEVFRGHVGDVDLRSILDTALSDPCSATSTLASFAEVGIDKTSPHQFDRELAGLQGAFNCGDRPVKAFWIWDPPIYVTVRGIAEKTYRLR